MAFKGVEKRKGKKRKEGKEKERTAKTSVAQERGRK